MVVAASRPILQLSARLVNMLCRLLPMLHALATYFLALALVPLLGSLITEPGATTLAALLLRDRIFTTGASQRVKYATLGVLFVNVSIGGTLSSFAAPPVLTVAVKWQWDTLFMLEHFGWRSALAVLANASAVTFLFRRQPIEFACSETADERSTAPPSAMLASAFFLLSVVLFSHHPAIFMGLLPFFIGYGAAYPRHHDPLILREALLVALFLAGLVVLGGQQQWWLQRVLTAMSPSAVYYGGSLVEGLNDEFKCSSSLAPSLAVD